MRVRLPLKTYFNDENKTPSTRIELLKENVEFLIGKLSELESVNSSYFVNQYEFLHGFESAIEELEKEVNKQQ